jgi:UDP-3-O-[3-hydroxymyristoyl] glucosamine N-acyltransferase
LFHDAEGTRGVKLRELAERLDCRLEGDGDIDILRVTGLEQATTGDVTFLANPRYSSLVARTGASAIIMSESAERAPCAMLRSSNPYLAFANAVRLLSPPVAPPVGLDPHSAVAPDAILGRDVSIGPFVAVGRGVRIGDRTVIYANVTIGDDAVVGADCVLHANVSLRERVILGDRVILQNGAVVGSDGYGFVKRPDGAHEKIPQVAIVVIEDDVEIGANTTIDRPAVGETRIKAGAKIDNLVQIAHGVSIGRNALLAAQVGIAGSSVIGDDVTLAGQVGVAGHLTIGKGTVATAQSGIPNSVDAGSFISGYPAIDNREWLRAAALFRRLPELKRAISALERRVAELEARLDESGEGRTRRS